MRKLLTILFVLVSLAGFSQVQKIEAENYTNISGLATHVCGDAGGGLQVGTVGEMNTGDYMEYAGIVAPVTGSYTITFRHTGWNTNAPISVYIDNVLAASTVLPNANGWVVWLETSVSFSVTAGTHNVKLVTGSLDFALNWFKFSTTAEAQKPVPDAGPDKNIKVSVGSASLLGTATAGLGATITNYQWAVIVGDGSLSAPNSASTNVTGMTNGQHKVRFTVTNSLGLSASDTMTINVSVCGGQVKTVVGTSFALGRSFSGNPADASYFALQPGDTVRVQGTFSYFAISGYTGTAQCPNVWINDTGQVALRDGFDIRDNSYLQLRGDGDPKVLYGFKVGFSGKPGNNGVAVAIQGKSSHYYIYRIASTGTGYFAWVKQDPLCDTTYNYMGTWSYKMDDIHISYCAADTTHQDVVYAGNTSPTGQRPITCNGQTFFYIPMRIKNVEVDHMVINVASRTGIQLSGADEGVNSIHHNYIENMGFEWNQQQGTGVSFGLAMGRAYANYVNKTFLYSVFDIGIKPSVFENNILDSAGYLDVKAKNSFWNVDSIASLYSIQAIGGRFIKNTWSAPINVVMTAKATVPAHLPVEVKLRNNSIGINAGGALDKDGSVAFANFGPPEDWVLSGNVVTANKKIIDGAESPVFRYTYNPGTGNQQWPNYSSTDTTGSIMTTNAGPSQIIGSSSVLLKGWSIPQIGKLLTAYAWSVVSGPNTPTITSATAATTTVTGLQSGLYVFRLTGTQSNGQQVSDDVFVQVTGISGPPPVVPVRYIKRLTGNTGKKIPVPVVTGRLRIKRF